MTEALALNEQQLAAVEHGMDDRHAGGPLLVIAGAGTGKTQTLAARTARMVLAGVDPNRILLLTFSRRASREMQRRVGLQVHRALGHGFGTPPPRLPWAGTFHGVGARLLRQLATRIGLAETFSILDRADAQDLLGLIRQETPFASSSRRFPLKETCLAIYSRAVNSTGRLGDVLAESFPWCTEWEDELKALFRAYGETKARQQVLDYDDLLLYWWQAMDADPGLAAQLGERFQQVLVDEYQDTNRLQAEILRLLKPDGHGLTVVGDDAQAIYGFRGAEVRNILDFPARFSPPARIVTLERNYRSTPPILEASNRVIAGASEGYAKRLWSDATGSARPTLRIVADEQAQATWVVDQVLRHRESGIPLKRQAVLFRTGSHALALELELARRNVPFVKFGGLKFLEAAHVKDLLSLLRWSQNLRHRMAAWRIVQRIEGVGAASARRLVDAIAMSTEPETVLERFRPPRDAVAGWRDFQAMFNACRAPDLRWPEPLAHALAWYEAQLPRLHDDAALRAADLRSLERLASSSGSRESFLTEMTLDAPEATSDESGDPLRDEDYLILSTIHSAKGQEWQAVYLLNVVDGCMPSDLATGRQAEIDEERRLLYVGMTRARRHLHLVAPQRFYVTQQTPRGDRHLYAGVSRFLPSALLGCFDMDTAELEAPDRDHGDGEDPDVTLPRAPGADAPIDTAAAAGAGIALRVAESIRRRWS